MSKSSKSTAPTPLQTELNSLLSRASSLSEIIGKQDVRVREIATLENERSNVRLAVDEEKIEFKAGSAKLAAISAEIDLHDHSRCRRATEIITDYHGIRSDAASLKWSVMDGINAAAAHVLKNRIAELSSTMKSWGGVEVTGTPVFTKYVAECCPVLKRLEAERDQLDQWSPDDRLEALAAILTPILAHLAEIDAPAKGPAIYGGHSERDRSFIVGYRHDETKFETIAEHIAPGDANAHYAALRSRPGFVGYDRIVKFSNANPDNEFNCDGQDQRQLDSRENSNAIPEGQTGSCLPMLEAASAWLKA